MNEVQTHIQGLLERVCADGRERGIQVSAYQHGRLIVNAWAGIANVNTGAPVTADTLFPVFSVTKGITATLIHRLVERGVLDYATPIAKYWPEFGANGKEHLTVEQALRHKVGLPKLPPETDFETGKNWDRICSVIASLAPQWEPGTRREYHALTYGWILGEVAQRATGLRFGQLLEDEIRSPLGITTMYVGMPEDCTAPVAWLENPDAVEPVDDGTPQAVPFGLQPLHRWMNRPDAHPICAPGASGIMNAFAIARHYAALLPGGVDGVELLPPHRVAIATTLQPLAPEYAETDQMPFGTMGYSLGRPGYVVGESDASFGHGGFGGSVGCADRSKGLAVGLTHNLLREDAAIPEILAALNNRLR